MGLGTRERRATAASPPAVADVELLCLFHELDADASGSLSQDEICRALQHNADFARLTGVGDGSRPLPPIAAGLIAQNLRNIMDSELGDGDGQVSPDEFVSLCRRLGAQQHQPEAEPSPAAPQHQPAAASPASAGAGSAGKEQRGSVKVGSRMRIFSMSGGSSSKQGAAAAGRAEARLHALHCMLREDVVAEAERRLAAATGVVEPEARAQLLHEGLCAVLGSCRRLMDDDDRPATASPGTPEADARADALELQQLRRDLCATKVALAEAENAREVAEHTLRKQALNGTQRRRWRVGMPTAE